MYEKDSERFKYQHRHNVIPRQTPHHLISTRRNQDRIMRNRPPPGQKMHLRVPPIATMFLAAPITRNPLQVRAPNDIPNSIQIGVRHDGLHILYRHCPSPARPDLHDDRMVEKCG